MVVGLLIFKYLPMYIYGKDILFDASQHIVTASFILYVIYTLIEKNKDWRIPFFIFSLSVLTIISLQRILDNAHNDVGLLLGLLISIVAIILPRINEIKKDFKF